MKIDSICAVYYEMTETALKVIKEYFSEHFDV